MIRVERNKVLLLLLLLFVCIPLFSTIIIISCLQPLIVDHPIISLIIIIICLHPLIVDHPICVTPLSLLARRR